jgi:5-methylcytosine-specific restriction endonuclease McrA
MVDHIVPREIAPELSLEPTNLVAACNTHHRLKTAWEQTYYGTGQHNKINIDAVRVTDINFLKFIFEQ